MSKHQNTQRLIHRAVGRVARDQKPEALQILADLPINTVLDELQSIRDDYIESQQNVDYLLNQLKASTQSLKEPPPLIPRILELSDPAPFLRLCEHAIQEQGTFNLDAFDTAQVWSLVGMAVLARQEQEQRLDIAMSREGSASRFAHAVGFTSVTANSVDHEYIDSSRTVKLQRIQRIQDVDSVAQKISGLILKSEKHRDTRQTINYVLVELLRNVLQHSKDHLGGIVAAQVNDTGPYRDSPTVQVAVGDSGIGIYKALSHSHPKIKSAKEALEKSIWPHVSGAFKEGAKKTEYNAGLGLFFIAEMAKLTAGNLVIASRGATLQIRSQKDNPESHVAKFIGSDGLGFPGTLVGFEVSLNDTINFREVFDIIKQTAIDRIPGSESNRWLKFEPAPENTKHIVIKVAAEDTAAAEKFAKQLKIQILDSQPVVLDFRHYEVCTQSYLHALLYGPLRIAWAENIPIYVENAEHAVRSGLELIESYALGKSQSR